MQPTIFITCTSSYEYVQIEFVLQKNPANLPLLRYPSDFLTYCDTCTATKAF